MPNRFPNTEIVQQLWSEANLPGAMLDKLSLSTTEPYLPSSFAVSTAAQTTIASAALAASLLAHHRGGLDLNVDVNSADAERECTAFFTLNDKMPNAWEKFSGLYPCADGYVRIHANFEHHRDGVLSLLALADAKTAQPEDIKHALKQWKAEDFESAAASRGLVVAAIRNYTAWQKHPHAKAIADLGLFSLKKIGDSTPRILNDYHHNQLPLANVRVLDLTRILAGPVCGRTLANYGADVLLVNSPHLPNIPAIVDTSRGKLSTHLDLNQAQDRSHFDKLLQDTHIFVQGYRPRALANLGYSPEQLARQYPGIIYVSLSAYGNQGPWQERRGFDSLVQSAAGFNIDEASAAHSEKPKNLPVPILDYASGFLMAYAAQAALYKQLIEGGSWHAEISLLQTANWLRTLGRVDADFNKKPEALKSYLEPFDCDLGELQAIPHAAKFFESHGDSSSAWPPYSRNRLRPSVQPGTHEPRWPNLR